MTTALLYSPEENHLGVIYSDLFGQRRFKRFVTEKERIMLTPRRITRLFVLKEVNLGPRTAHLFFSNVFTADRIPLELELKVFYRFDPRNTVSENFTQVLKLRDQAFEAIIRTNIEKMIRNDVFVQKRAEHILFSHAGRRELQKVLSFRIAERVKNFGIAVNLSYGASIMNMQPDKIYMKALQEESASNAQSRAAEKRIEASLKNIKGLTPEEAVKLLYTQMASAVAKTGQMPEHIIHNEYVESQTSEQGFYKKTPSKRPGPKVPSSERKLPLAE